MVRVSLRVSVLTLASLEIVACVVVAWVLTQSAAEKVILDMAKDSQSKSKEALHSHLLNALKTIIDVCHINQQMFSSGHYDYRNYSTYMPIFLNLLRSKTGIWDVWYGSIDGGDHGYFIRAEDPTKWGEWTYNTTTNTEEEYDIVPGTDQRLNLVTSFTYNSIVEGAASYVSNKEDPSIDYWTPAYLWHGRFWVSYLRSAIEPDGTWVGCVGSDFQLGFVTEILIPLFNNSKHSTIIVEESSSGVMGTYPTGPVISCYGKPIMSRDCPDEGKPGLLNGDQLPNPLFRGMWSIYKERNSTEFQEMKSINGNEYIVSISKLFKPGGLTLSWIIILASEKKSFLTEFQRSTPRTLAYCAVVAFCAAIINSIIIYASIRAILSLLPKMARAANMDLDGLLNISKTPFSEVYDMQVSFVGMCEKLQEVKNYLPSALFAENEDAEKEEKEKEETVLIEKGNGNGKLFEKGKRSVDSRILDRSKRDANSRSSKSSRNSHQHHPQSKSLGWHQVVVVMIRIEGMDHLTCEEGTVQELSHLFLSNVVTSTNTHKGTLMRFEADAAIIAWGAVGIPQHISFSSRHAASLALDIVRRMKTALSNWKPSNGDIKSFEKDRLWTCVGIVGGKMLRGSNGVPGAMGFHICSYLLRHCQTLMDINIALKTNILLPQAMSKLLQGSYVLNPVDVIKFPNSTHRVPLYELIDSQAAHGGEWMYELAENTPSHLLNNAFDLFVNGKYEAITVINEYLQINPDERIGLRLQQLCNHMDSLPTPYCRTLEILPLFDFEKSSFTTSRVDVQDL